MAIAQSIAMIHKQPTADSILVVSPAPLRIVLYNKQTMETEPNKYEQTIL